MSDRQQLAEQATALCVGAMGLAGMPALAAAVPVAVIAALAYDRWKACDSARLRRAQRAAFDALEAEGVPDGDIAAARRLLKSARGKIRFDPERAARQVADGTLIANMMRAVFEDSLDRETEGTRVALETVLRAAFDETRQDADFRAAFTEGAVMEVLRRHDVTVEKLDRLQDTANRSEAKLDDTQAMVRTLLDRERDSASQLGVREAQLIALAQHVARDIKDPDEALRELTAMVLDAAQFKATAAPAETETATGGLSGLRASVLSLSAEGKLDEAAEILTTERTAWLDRLQAEAFELHDLMSAQARQRRDIAAMVEAEQLGVALRLLPLDQTFDALCDRVDDSHERGRASGLRLDAEFAVALAKATQAQARGAAQKGRARLALARVLFNQSTFEQHTGSLDAALDAIRSALKALPRERVPIDWAKAQARLSVGLCARGLRDDDPKTWLTEAVSAGLLALEELTPEDTPKDWARAQDALGDALVRLGHTTADPAKITQGVKALDLAASVLTREEDPFAWAALQMLLGHAHAHLAVFEPGLDRLHKAVAAYEAAATVMTRDAEPMSWADLQYSLCAAEVMAFERSNLPEHLDRAELRGWQALERYRAVGAETAARALEQDWLTKVARYRTNGHNPHEG